MLKLKRKTPAHVKAFMVAVTVALIIIVVVTFNMLLIMWDKDICGNVEMSDYAKRDAPIKCQQMWDEGRL